MYSYTKTIRLDPSSQQKIYEVKVIGYCKSWYPNLPANSLAKYGVEKRAVGAGRVRAPRYSLKSFREAVQEDAPLNQASVACGVFPPGVVTKVSTSTC